MRATFAKHYPVVTHKSGPLKVVFWHTHTHRNVLQQASGPGPRHCKTLLKRLDFISPQHFGVKALFLLRNIHRIHYFHTAAVNGLNKGHTHTKGLADEYANIYTLFRMRSNGGRRCHVTARTPVEANVEKKKKKEQWCLLFVLELWLVWRRRDDKRRNGMASLGHRVSLSSWLQGDVGKPTQLHRNPSQPNSHHNPTAPEPDPIPPQSDTARMPKLAQKSPNKNKPQKQELRQKASPVRGRFRVFGRTPIALECNPTAPDDRFDPSPDEN